MKLTNITNESSIFNSLKNEEEKTIIPPGYTEIKLSTKGLVGAPEIIHIRNFKVKEIIALSLTNDIDLPVRLIEILNNMILEDVDVGNWHQNEIEELMVYIFYTFYRKKLEDVVFPILEEDINYLKQQPNGNELIEAINSKEWIPRTEISIASDVSTYDLPNNFTTKIKILNKKCDFYVEFNYIKYRDQIIIRKWIENYFKEETLKYKKIEAQLNFNKNILKQIDKNPNLVDQLIVIPEEEKESYENFLNEKMQTTIEVVRLISISNYNGMDVSTLSLSDKYKLMSSDARIDYNLISKLEKKQKNLNFGIKPEVHMINPITGQDCERRFSFRIPLILQAIQLSGDDDEDDNING